MGDTTTQETPSTTIPQEIGKSKHPNMHTRGICKNSKVHKQFPQYTITEDDINLMAEKVHECTNEEFEDSQHQRGRIQDELANIRHVLEQKRVVQMHDRGTQSLPTTIEVEERATSSKQDTIQTIAQASPNFQVTSTMFWMDEAITQTPLKDLAKVELVMERVPTKSLYKLQVSIMQEVESRARKNAAELQHMMNGKESLDMLVEHVKLETKKEKR